jgi:mono/diheme cytochrome c family protein
MRNLKRMCERAIDNLIFATAFLALMVGSLVGCDNMRDQARYNPEAPSEYYADGASARPIVNGTVARGQARTDELLYRGTTDGKLADVFPFPITMDDLQRGRQRFNIYCSPCHGATGYGDGMVVRRGFTRPPSFHIERLREVPVGHFFDVVSNGWGAMYSYNARVSVPDRWRIAAYIRALQLSQNVHGTELTEDDLHSLQSAGTQPSQPQPQPQGQGNMP